VQQLLPVLGDSSTIVFLSSLGARAAVGALSALASTKGVIDTLVKYFATALGPRGIRVNAVAPGVIDTDMSNLTKTEDDRAAVVGMQAPKRFGGPGDVASVIAFLVSDETHWISGDAIAVDGGSRLRAGAMSLRRPRVDESLCPSTRSHGPRRFSRGGRSHLLDRHTTLRTS
jgi:3-oxoacyl-[acyl-carrier protein] reductase